MARPKKPPTLKQAKAVCEKYRPLLMACEGVRGVTYGIKQRGGVYGFTAAAGGAPEFAVIVSLEKKNKKLKEGDRGFIPKELDGVPTDIVKAGPPPKVKAHAGSISGGSEIELIHQDGSSGGRGTLSAIVRDAGSKQLYALTNAHVAFGRSLTFTAGDTVVLNPGHTPLGIPERNGFELPYSQLYGVLDAGAIRLNAGLNPPRMVALPHGKLAVVGFEQITTADVEQFGAKTAATRRGKFVKVEESADVQFEPGFSRTLSNLLRIQPDASPFGVAGDSGSVVVGSVGTRRVAVGLYVGIDGKNGDGFAMPLSVVLDGMQLVQ